ncbi:MAG: peptidylprolyl isomerase [Stappiaceae bacterium]
MFFSRMTKVVGPLALGIAVVTTPVVAQDATPDKVVATVNGQEIKQSSMDFAASQFKQTLDRMPEDQRHQVLVDVLVDMVLLAQAGKEQELDQTPEFKERANFLMTQSLRDAYFAKNIDGQVSEADVKARYDKEFADYKGEAEISASHILVEAEDTAKEIIKELDGGKDFAELAKEKSTGPSGPNGGDLGFFGQGRMVKEFETAAFALEEGTYTKEPVKTQFGWHVIKVDSKRTQPAPAFDQVEPQLRQALIREKFDEIMTKLKSDASIVLADKPAVENAEEDKKN